MALDPQAKAMLDLMPAMPDFNTLDLAVVRAGMAAGTLNTGEPEAAGSSLTRSSASFTKCSLSASSARRNPRSDSSARSFPCSSRMAIANYAHSVTWYSQSGQGDRDS